MMCKGLEMGMKNIQPHNRYKVTINWYGENLTFYTITKSERVALRCAIFKCAQKVGYSFKYVRDYVMEDVNDRFKVEVK
jgi:hypothetical protein